MSAKTIPVQPFDLVVFGATGDLAKRKIFPSLFKRFVAGQMPIEARIIGAARSDMDQAGFVDAIRNAFHEFASVAKDEEEALEQFLGLIDYVPIDVFGDAGWDTLRDLFREDVIRAFYLSVAPSLFGDIASKLGEYGIKTADSRIIVEKPFGKDAPSARELNQKLRQNFEEKQIYRIDHYLGKETVQNLMALRFANGLFEQSWNAQNIDHVQISVSETLGVEGRGEYFDKSGSMRDMVQNHLLQLLCLIAMEPPARFTPDAVRDEKLKVLRALDSIAAEDVVRGQYRSSEAGENYVDHAKNPDSRTESFVAMKVDISNWRWSGTPFYLRTGKKLRQRISEIVISFKKPPHSIFSMNAPLKGNELIIRLQPDEGITLKMTIKEPGPGGMRLAEVPLDMSFADALDSSQATPDAYERLIMDVIRGDQTLFMRDDELETAWEWMDPIIAAWDAGTQKPFGYQVGSAGPEEALMMVHKDGRRWRGLGE
ncbi:MAG: glucose-6-phosphate dehydrogenase [Hyphomicrobiales bacterium]